MNIRKNTFRLAADEYFPTPEKKEAIVLHFTAGQSARSAYEAWADRSGGVKKVATAYLVDTGGEIYECFRPANWAYHLGLSEHNPYHIQDRRTIGIEIVNVGPLRPLPNQPEMLAFWPRQFTTPYCLRSQTARYVERPFRHEQFFATFSDAQLEQVAELVASLCRDFGIPATIPAEADIERCDPEYFGQYRGICSHQNFVSWKFDIGPAWDWRRFHGLVQAAMKEEARA